MDGEAKRVPWTTLPGNVVDWDASPSDALLAVLSNGGYGTSTKLRILEFASGRIVLEQAVEADRVFWLSDGRLWTVHTTRLRIHEHTLRDGAQRDVGGMPTVEGVRNASVDLTADRKHLTLLVEGPPLRTRWRDAAWVIDTDGHGKTPWKVPLAFKDGPAPDSAHLAKLWGPLERASGHWLMVYRSTYDTPLQLAVVHVRARTVESLNLPFSRSEQVVPTWVTRARIFVRDHDFDADARVWRTVVGLYDVVARRWFCEARANTDESRSETYQALEALQNGAHSADGKRHFGLATEMGSNVHRAWVVRIEDETFAPRSGPAWPGLLHSTAWLGDGVLATLSDPARANAVYHARTPENDMPTRVLSPHGEDQVFDVQVTRKGGWVVAGSLPGVAPDRHLAYVDSDAFRAGP